MPNGEGEADPFQAEEFQPRFSAITTERPSFGGIRPADALIEGFIEATPGTVAEIARRLVFPALSDRTPFGEAQVRTALFDAAMAINETFGEKWDRAVADRAVAEAAATISTTYSTDPDRALATYLAILQMPAAYDSFTNLMKIEGRPISIEDLDLARKLGLACGIFPFC